MGDLCFQEGWHWQIGDGTTTALTATPRASFFKCGPASEQGLSEKGLSGISLGAGYAGR